MKKLMTRSFIALLIGAISVGVLAQQPASQIAPSAERLRQYIAYLASDALEGRRTGTPGANDAAHYIAGEFSLLGLHPGLQMARPARTRGENRARYLQPFPYVASVEVGKNNMLSVSEARADIAQLRIGEDWMPLGFSSNVEIKSAPAV